MADPVTTTSGEAVVRGRRAVLDAVLAVVEAACAGHGGAVTIVGEAGIGKTAVLDEVARAASASAQVLRLTGVEAEVELVWSGLASLVEGLADGPALERLAPARAAALRTALAMDSGEQSVDPFAVALATRDLLVEAAETQPLVVVVDDLHWLDPSTRRTLAYIARRVELERLAIVSTRRPGPGEATDTGRTITLDALAPADAEALLAGLGVSSPEVRRRVAAASGGIPLVLVEAAHLLDEDQRAGRAELPDPLPIGPSGQRVVDLVLQRLPPPVLTALVTAASEPTGDLRRILAALDQQGLGLAELEAAEDGGVIVLDGDQLTFRHPLMRSAAYYDAPRAARRAAHRALAALQPTSPLTRAWHLARAAVGPDEEAAQALDDAAVESLRRGSPSTAARAWEQASRLTAAPADRLRRLRLAATALADSGLAPMAELLLDRADVVAADHPDDDELVERIRRQQLRLRLPASSGATVVETGASLRALADEVRDAAPDLAVDLLMDALAADIRGGAFAGLVAGVEAAATLRERVDPDRARRIDIVEGGLRVAQGNQSGAPLLDRYQEMLGAGGHTTDAPFLTEVVAPALGFLRRTDQSDALLAQLEEDLRARGAIRPLVAVLGARAMAHYGRSFPAALTAASQAIELASEAPQLVSVAAGILALGGAVVGDPELCATASRLLEDIAEPERRVFAPVGPAYLAYHEGRYEDAIRLYEPILELLPVGRGFLRWEIEWIESLARVGRRADALDLVARLEDALPEPVIAQTGIDRARGLLAVDDEEALACFRRAVEVASSANDFAVGRAEILLGERLRRMRRRAEARSHLERAVELLRAVGATLPAARAAAELQAAGGVAPGADASPELLTPHELQIAKLVVAGASNRDLAHRLFISPRTVESHLTTIFRKLGLRNRRELQARALVDAGLQPDPSVGARPASGR